MSKLKHGYVRVRIGGVPIDIPRDRFDLEPCQCEECKPVERADDEGLICKSVSYGPRPARDERWDRAIKAFEENLAAGMEREEAWKKAVLGDLIPEPLVDVTYGVKTALKIGGVTVAVEGDLCRDCLIPDRCWSPENLENAAAEIKSHLEEGARRLRPPEPTLVEQLRQLSDDDRLEVILRFCTHCGTEQPEPPGRRCQCWNDE